MSWESRQGRLVGKSSKGWLGLPIKAAFLPRRQWDDGLSTLKFNLPQDQVFTGTRGRRKLLRIFRKPPFFWRRRPGRFKILFLGGVGPENVVIFAKFPFFGRSRPRKCRRSISIERSKLPFWDQTIIDYCLTIVATVSLHQGGMSPKGNFWLGTWGFFVVLHCIPVKVRTQDIFFNTKCGHLMFM